MAPVEQIQVFTGKKVRIATRAFHHVCGVLRGMRDGRLVVTVKGSELLVDPTAVVSMTEATPEEAEFVK